MIARLAFLSLLTLVFTAGKTAEADNKTLLIGINYYAEFEPVDGAMTSISDLRTFYGSNVQQGTRAKTMSDLDDGTKMFPIKSNIIKQIDSITKKCSKGQTCLLVHFGQTAVVDNKLYLVPADGRQNTPSSLIAYDDLFTKISKASGTINFITFTKTFDSNVKSRMKDLIGKHPFAFVPLHSFSASRFAEAISGGADLFSAGNQNGVVELGELTAYMNNGLKAQGFCSLAQTVTITKNQLRTNTDFNSFETLNKLRKTCIASIKANELRSELSRLEKKRVEINKNIANGLFAASINRAKELIAGYKQLLQNNKSRASLGDLISYATKQEKMLIQEGATSLYPTQFTALVILKDKALSNYTRGNYTQALKNYTELTNSYLKLERTILDKEYNAQVTTSNQKVLASFGGESWENVRQKIAESKTLFNEGSHRNSVSRFKNAIKRLPKAFKEASNNLKAKIERFSSSTDYKTGLVFIEQLAQLNGYDEEARSLKANLLNNKRFNAGETFSSKSGIKLNYIPHGEFVMGSAESEALRDTDEVQHKVTISRGFFMGQYEVSEQQWLSVMGTNYRPPQGIDSNDVEYASTGHPTFPRNCVTWNEAITFCKKLSQIDGVTYRLPTEAEWEYACRANSKASYNTYLDSLAVTDANIFNDSSDHYGLKPIGSYKRPNQWGLYDMHGNVWEWCSDWKAPYYAAIRKDPKGPETTQSDETAAKVVRGGSWFDDANSARSANRWESSPNISSSYIGFRVVLVAESIK